MFNFKCEMGIILRFLYMYHLQLQSSVTNSEISDGYLISLFSRVTGDIIMYSEG